MQAEFMGKFIISTPKGFKVAGLSTNYYEKTTSGLLLLTQAIIEGKE